MTLFVLNSSGNKYLLQLVGADTAKYAKLSFVTRATFFNTERQMQFPQIEEKESLWRK